VFTSGALGQAFTSDRFGRRGTILIWAAIFTIGTAIQTGTDRSIVQISIGRFIAGLGVGAMSGEFGCPFRALPLGKIITIFMFSVGRKVGSGLNFTLRIFSFHPNFPYRRILQN
jgi:MFS family permease